MYEDGHVVQILYLSSMDDLNFNLLQEGIDKNKQTLETIGTITLLLWERAKVELEYIKRIEALKRQANTAVEENPDSFKEFINIIEVMKDEGTICQDIHQMMYDVILAEDGPYKKLLTHTGDKGQESDGGNLQRIESEFQVTNHKRLQLRIAKMRHSQSIDEMESNLIKLEEQLSNRSRLTDSRKGSAKGNRKIDSILTNVSNLRKSIITTKALLVQTEDELNAITQDKKPHYQEQFVELKAIYQNRVDFVYKVLTNYMKKAKSYVNYNRSQEYKRAMDELSKRLAANSNHRLVEEGWSDVERIARMKKAGTVVGYDMFVCKSLRELRCHAQDSSKDKGKQSIDQGIDGGLERSMSQRTEENTPRTPTVVTTHGLRADDSRDTSPSSSRHTLFKMTCTSSEEACGSSGTPGRSITNVRPQVSQISGISSSSRVETIEMTNESSESKVSPPFQTKDFCVLDDDDEDDDDDDDENDGGDEKLTPTLGNGAVLTFDTSLMRLVPRLRSQLSATSIVCHGQVSSDEELANQRNVKVIANHDYMARRSSELSFKKGQTIKQKIGVNENGYAYGWIKEGKLSPKRYGWYPIALVSRHY